MYNVIIVPNVKNTLVYGAKLYCLCMIDVLIYYALILSVYTCISY